MNSVLSNYIQKNRLVKVMAGDTIEAAVGAFYQQPTTPQNNAGIPPDQILSGLFQALVAPATKTLTLHGGQIAAEAGIMGTGLTARDLQALKAKNPNRLINRKPKAYLDYIFFDNQLKFVTDGSGVQQVNGDPGELETLASGKVVAKRNGYVYVYTSNESTQDVLFYNLGVTQITGPVLEETHYYPFGLTMAGISSMAPLKLENRFKFNGKELNNKEFSDGSGLEWYDYGARLQDPQVGKWWAIDPLANNYFSFSPYNYALDDPINTIDIDGRRTTSTHTDSLGKVLAVFNDNDNGVYVHNGTSVSQIESAHSKKNTGAGGTKVGETEFWDEFASHDANGNILGDKNGNFANKNAKINYGFSIDGYINLYREWARDGINSSSSASAAKNWLKINSKLHGLLDIKQTFDANSGYLLDGKYVSGETAGNYLFGADLETLREFAILDNLRYPFTNKESVFYRAAEAFGAYHNSSNRVNNPSVKPYYGEIPYSGRGIVLGYYSGNTSNAIFNDNGGSAIYGNVKIK